MALLLAATAVTTVHIKPSSATASAEGIASITASTGAFTAEEAVEAGIETPTVAAGAFSGIPSEDNATHVLLEELTVAVEAATEIETDSLLKALYDQFGYPTLLPSPVGTILDKFNPSGPTVVQATEQLAGKTSSVLGDGLTAAETVETDADVAVVTTGSGKNLNTRMSAARRGIQGNALTALTEEEAADALISSAATATDKQNDLAASMKIMTRIQMAQLKYSNDQAKLINNLVFAVTLRDEQKDEAETDREKDIDASMVLISIP